MNNFSDNASSRHTIRLRGPCKLFWMRNGTQQAEVRVHIPCEIGPELFEVTAISDEDCFVLQRSFGKPSGLDPTQKVTLELTGFENAKRATVNHKKNAEVAQDFEKNSVSLSVGEALLQHNQLEIEFRTVPAKVGEIVLAIDSES